MLVQNQDLITVVVGIIVSLVLAYFAGGASIIFLVTMLLDKIANSPVAIAYLKHLADSASPELLELLTEGRKVVDEVLPDDEDEKVKG